MSNSLLIQNRQRAIRLNARLLRTITHSVLTKLLELEQFDLAISIVRGSQMAQINETFLQHSGSTDVITFDYFDNVSPAKRTNQIHGEIFVCIDDAIAQAREFKTSWQSEITRYVIHGILHLLGFDDLRPAARKKMKREENRLLKKVDSLFPLRKLGGGSKLRA